MKVVRVLLVPLIVLACASLALANSVAPDPIIKIKDPACPNNCTFVQGTQFNFSSPPSGIGALTFNNASGVDWTSLRLVEFGVPAGAITCITDVFLSCVAKSGSNGSTIILLSGLGPGFGGITTGLNFSIQFECSTGCWPGNLPFHAVANVPEPTSMALVLTGLAGIATRRKWLQRIKG
jgi:PEP-CTERM motif-containing protein